MYLCFSYFEPHFNEKFHWKVVFKFGHVTIFAKRKCIFIIIVTNIYKVYLKCKLVYDTHKLKVIMIITNIKYNKAVS